VRLVEEADAVAIAKKTLASLGIAKSDAHQLQALDYHRVIAAASAVRPEPRPEGGLAARTLAPMVDGRSILAHPFEPSASALCAEIPMMIGTCKDEATLFLAGDIELGRMSPGEARKRFDAEFGARSSAAFNAYRTAYATEDPSYWVSSMMTDRMFRSDTIDQADRKSRQQAPVFMYRVDYEPRVLDRLFKSPHGTEVPLVFGTKAPAAFIGAGAEVDALSSSMMTAWINFARTGNPSQPSLVWPKYDEGKRLNMIFDINCVVRSDPDRVARDRRARGLA
jgi:para-nitrobenzyl esterase